MTMPFDSGRRGFVRLLLALPIALVSGAWSLVPRAAGAAARTKPVFPPTPDCGDDDEPTPSETAGPFFKPRSPLRTSLREPGIPGTPVLLTGRVFARNCRPLAGVLVDFWHADGDGEYDNDGYRCRGHQFTDANGRYRLETVVPGLYPGRTRHFHVRLQAARGRVLTTQLYFPGEPRNEEDGLYRRDLLVTLRDDPAGKQARFHFVLAG